MANPTLDYLIDRAAAANRAATKLDQLDELHHPVDSDDGIVAQRCAHCVAGYDPTNGQLVYAAWPCLTAQILGVPE